MKNLRMVLIVADWQRATQQGTKCVANESEVALMPQSLCAAVIEQVT